MRRRRPCLAVAELVQPALYGVLLLECGAALAGCECRGSGGRPGLRTRAAGGRREACRGGCEGIDVGLGGGVWSPIRGGWEVASAHRSATSRWLDCPPGAEGSGPRAAVGPTRAFCRVGRRARGS